MSASGPFREASQASAVPLSLHGPTPVPASRDGVPQFDAGSMQCGQTLPPVGVGLGNEGMMSLVRASVAESTWNSYGHRRPNVWLIGHSYIFWASQRAACRPGGKELGLRDIDVYWRGIRGLVWNQVLLEAMEISRIARPPTILVIHAGGNDLCFLKLAELMTLMRADLERIISFFSEVILVWSELIPRVVWQGARDAEAIERSRRTINCRLSRFVRSKSGVVIRHRQLEGDNRRLMGTDGVHLNEIGLDIFLSGLQDGVEQALLLLRGGRGLV
ncbi:uncharacterized protein ACNLHF_019593 isoform 1-T1 [Anomaloglossus baeobatrachus]